MLPFLKNRDDGVAAGPVETLKRDHDDGFDALDAIADDILEAVKQGDKARLRGALDAMCAYIQDIDAGQDQAIMEESPK